MNGLSHTVLAVALVALLACSVSADPRRRRNKAKEVAPAQEEEEESMSTLP